MKLLTKLFFSLLIIVGIFFSYYMLKPAPNLNPTTDNNQFLNKLILALKQNNLEYNHLQTNLAWNQISFLINQTQIIVSTKKNPEKQVLVLPQIFKHARINQQLPTTIDLSLDHPYATLQNN